MQPKRVGTLTVPPLSFKLRTLAYVRVLTAMHESASVGDEDDGRAPATICRVVNLADGKEYDFLVPTLVQSAWTRYGGEYVGKCFEVRMSKDAAPGKRYKTAEVYEIEDPKDERLDDGYTQPIGASQSGGEAGNSADGAGSESREQGRGFFRGGKR